MTTIKLALEHKKVMISIFQNSVKIATFAKIWLWLVFSILDSFRARVILVQWFGQNFNDADFNSLFRDHRYSTIVQSISLYISSNNRSKISCKNVRWWLWKEENNGYGWIGACWQGDPENCRNRRASRRRRMDIPVFQRCRFDVRNITVNKF